MLQFHIAYYIQYACQSLSGNNVVAICLPRPISLKMDMQSKMAFSE